MHTSVPQNISSILTTELTIPVPWGHISAKAWGNPENKPVLAVHGLQDNAGSFDRIIPLLPPTFYYVCMDLPSHGLSSRFPHGILIDMMSYINAIHRVVCHMNWDKFYYMGHSLGGLCGTYYTAIFPEKVVKLIVLDALVHRPVEPAFYFKHFTTMIENLTEIEQNVNGRELSVYTYDQALDKLMQMRLLGMNRETAESLLQRCIRKNEKGYYFSTDPRLKFIVLNPMKLSQVFSLLSSIRCEHLLILTDTLYAAIKLDAFVGAAFGSDLGFYEGEIDKTALDIFSKNKNFQLEIIEGNHDVHYNEPELVAPVVTQWLLKTRSHL